MGVGVGAGLPTRKARKRSLAPGETPTHAGFSRSSSTWHPGRGALAASLRSGTSGRHPYIQPETLGDLKRGSGLVTTPKSYLRPDHGFESRSPERPCVCVHLRGDSRALPQGLAVANADFRFRSECPVRMGFLCSLEGCVPLRTPEQDEMVPGRAPPPLRPALPGISIWELGAASGVGQVRWDWAGLGRRFT